METWFQRFLKGELGFKTIAGALLILASLVVQGLGHPDQAEYVLKFGEALGLVGLRDALGKLPK